MRIFSVLIIGIIFTNYVSGTKDCAPCPDSCQFGFTYTKRADVCTCSCAPDPCLRKKCPEGNICQVRDRKICRMESCISLKVGVCTNESENSAPTQKDGNLIEGQLRIVPSSIELHEGDWSELKCELHDATESTIRPFAGVWTRDHEKTLPSNFRLMPNNTIRIESARESNSGTYRCTASSKYEIIHETVNVRVIPRTRDHIFNDFQVFIRVSQPNSHNQVLYLGSKLVLECLTRGLPNDPVKEVTWMKSGGGPDRSAVTSLTRDMSTLEIKNLMMLDYGTYTCMATSEDGQISRNSVHIKSDLYRPSIFTYSIEKTHQTETTTTTTTAAPSTRKQEKETLVFLKNKRPISYSPMSDRPSSIYGTEIETFDGNNQPFKFVKYLQDFPDASITPEVDLIGPREVKVNEGASLVIEFRVYNGGGTVTISKYDDDLPAGSRVEVNDDIYKLYLNNMRREDKGYYTCTVTNKYGASDRKAIMVHVGKCRPDKPLPTTTPDMRVYQKYPINRHGSRVLPRANIVKVDDFITVKEGQSIIIECNLIAADKSYFNKLEDQISVDNFVRREPNKIVLEISNSKEKDSGTYECMADNEIGTDSDKIQVRVEANPVDDSPRQPRASILKTQDVRVLQQGESTVIECEVERSIDVEFNRGGQEMPRTLKRTHENNLYKLTIYELEPSDSGYYYCIAKNEFGADRCWVYLDVRPAQSPSVPESIQQQPDRVDNEEQVVVDRAPQEIVPANQPPIVRINETQVRMSNSPDFLELNLVEGQTVVLECRVRNGHITTFKKYEGSPVSYVHKKFSEHERLIISNLSTEDAGYYICEAKNDYDINRDTLLISVQQRDK